MRVSTRFTDEYRNDAMAANPHIAARLVELFEAKFDPVATRLRRKRPAIRQQVVDDLQGSRRSTRT
jgi:NAD-specific glutamate dehydrogenase